MLAPSIQRTVISRTFTLPTGFRLLWTRASSLTQGSNAYPWKGLLCPTIKTLGDAGWYPSLETRVKGDEFHLCVICKRCNQGTESHYRLVALFGCVQRLRWCRSAVFVVDRKTAKGCTLQVTNANVSIRKVAIGANSKWQRWFSAMNADMME